MVYVGVTHNKPTMLMVMKKHVTQCNDVCHCYSLIESSQYLSFFSVCFAFSMSTISFLTFFESSASLPSICTVQYVFLLRLLCLTNVGPLNPWLKVFKDN